MLSDSCALNYSSERSLHSCYFDQLAHRGLLTIHENAIAIDTRCDDRTNEDGNDHDNDCNCNLPPRRAANANTHEHRSRCPERNI
jgi:hypothetical protein